MKMDCAMLGLIKLLVSCQYQAPTPDPPCLYLRQHKRHTEHNQALNLLWICFDIDVRLSQAKAELHVNLFLHYVTSKTYFLKVGIYQFNLF